MNSIDFAENFGFLPFRRARGKYTSPHFSFKYSNIIWHVDSSKGKHGEFNLITHAHTDHYGQRNVDNKFAIASKETAKILEVCSDKKFSGITFDVESDVKVDNDIECVKIKTYDTKHIPGSAAFLFNKEILITGDVKDYKSLPKCKVLITEATYGSPEFVFEDEIEKLLNVERGSVLGAYPIGKSQRVAKLLSSAGYDVHAEEKIAKICKCLKIDVNCYSGNSNNANFDALITSPRNMYSINSNKKYIITAQKFYRIPRIAISDHLDYEGIIRMIEHCNPEQVLFYHGSPSEELINTIKGMGYDVTKLKDLERMNLK